MISYPPNFTENHLDVISKCLFSFLWPKDYFQLFIRTFSCNEDLFITEYRISLIIFLVISVFDGGDQNQGEMNWWWWYENGIILLQRVKGIEEIGENLLNSGGGQNKHFMNLSHVETEFEEHTVWTYTHNIFLTHNVCASKYLYFFVVIWCLLENKMNALDMEMTEPA